MQPWRHTPTMPRLSQPSTQLVAASLLEWTDACRIGIDMLDYEHRDLFARLNELHDELMRHEDRGSIEACLGEIHARMAAHFALEEKFMRDKRYKDYEAHKAEHDDLLDEFIEFMMRFSRDPDLEYGQAEHLTLKRWVIDHMQTTDRRMSEIAAGPSGRR